MRFRIPKLAFEKHLRTLLIAVLFLHLADYLIIPIFPIILNINKQLRPSEIGIIIGSGSLSFQAGSILGGIISDKIGRKITLVTGSLIEAGALMGFAFSNTYFMFLLFEIVNGFGGGLFAPTIKAAIAEHTTHSIDERTTAFSLRGMAANLGIAIGGLIPLIVIGIKYKTLFYIAAIIYFGLMLFSLIFIKNSLENKKLAKISIKRYLEIFKNKQFLIFSFLTILVWGVYSQLSLLLPLRASEVLKNSKAVGSIWSITSIIVVILQTYITTHFIKKIHLYNSLLVGTIIMGVGIFLIGLSNTYIILLVSAAIFVVGEMLTTPSIDSMTSELANDEIIGAYFSVANILYGIGTAGGSFIGGELINYYGINKSLTPWYIFLISSIIIAVIIFIIKKLPYVKQV